MKKSPPLSTKPEWAKGLSDRQITAVLYIAEKGKITTRDYCRLVNVSRVTAYRDLSELCERALIKQYGGGRTVHYTLIQ